jgi:outer membrane lipoprotein carrier protein
VKIIVRTLLLASLLAVVTTPARAAGLNEVIDALEAPFRSTTVAEKRIRDYTADFFQQSRIASLDREQRARGEVKVLFDHRGEERGLERDAERRVATVMFHWQYEEPTRQELVSDGKTMWVYLPENNQVIQSDIGLVSKARENDPMTFLTGLGQLSRDFQINFATPNRDVEGNYILELRPRRTTTLFNRMVIVVNRYAVDIVAAEDKTAAQEPRSKFEKELSKLAPPKPAPGEAFGSRRRSDDFPMLSTTVYDQNGNSTLIEFSNIRYNVGLAPGSFRFMLPAGVEVVRPTGKEMGF